MKKSREPKPTLASISAVPRLSVSFDTPLMSRGYDADGRADAQTPGDVLASSEPTPEALLADDSRRQLLRELLREILNPIQLHVIESLFLDDVSPFDLARDLKCASTDIWTLRAAALEQIRHSPHALKLHELLKRG